MQLLQSLKYLYLDLFYNFTSNFEYSHTYSIGITISKTFTQGKSSEQIEDIVRKCMDKESVSIYSHRLTADMTESEFVFAFLDEILHSAAFTVCIDKLLSFASHWSNDKGIHVNHLAIWFSILKTTRLGWAHEAAW